MTSCCSASLAAVVNRRRGVGLREIPALGGGRRRPVLLQPASIQGQTGVQKDGEEIEKTDVGPEEYSTRGSTGGCSGPASGRRGSAGATVSPEARIDTSSEAR